MIGRMAGLHCDKSAATSRRHLVVRDQLSFNDGTIVAGFNHTRYQPYGLVRRRWPSQRDLVVSSDCAGRMVRARALHQMVGSGPVAVAVEHRADDAATQHSRKRFLIRFGLPLGDHFFALRKAANVQALFVCRSTTKTGEVGRVSFLNAFSISFEFRVRSFGFWILKVVKSLGWRCLAFPNSKLETRNSKLLILPAI